MHKIKSQQGAALITALVILVIVTMLGLAGMTNNTMNEKMAANAQEANRAFQTAEAGIEKAFSSPTSSFSLTTPFTPPSATPFETSGTDLYGAKATFTVTYVQETAPKRGLGWDSNYTAYHFDIGSEGTTTNSEARASLHSGTFQIGNKN